jgi:phosphate transport system substrate-binding protein
MQATCLALARSIGTAFGMAALGLFAVTSWAAPMPASRFTPPPKLESIPPQPAAPGSYEVELVERLAPYHPDQPVSGVIRLWGHGNVLLPWMKHLVELWQKDFRRFHPDVSFDYQMHGTSSGIPALFTGLGDVAILGEEILPEAVSAFERAKGYPPLGIEIATGSLDVRNFDYAQQFFVHKDNPLNRITLQQLDAIYGAEHRRGQKNIRTWGELGLTGDWANQPIVPYGWAIDDSFGAYLQEYLLGGSHRWNCALREYVHKYQPDGGVYDHGQQILDALDEDRFGIAASNIRYAGPNVKPLALALRSEGPFVQASKQTLIDHSYPLARTIPAVIDRQPGMPVDPKIKEFLRYLLSRDGQRIVNRDGRYLPLSSELIAKQLEKLE